MSIVKWFKSLFRKPRHHKFLWNPPAVDRDTVEVSVFRWDHKHPDGTRVHYLTVCCHAKNQSGWIPAATVTRHNGISATQYRELLRSAHTGDGKILIVKSHLFNNPSPDFLETTVNLSMFHDPGMDTWTASYWNLVNGVWLHRTHESSCIRAILGHVLEHSASEKIQISGYRGAGITIDRDDASITYALFRDQYGILGINPDNWHSDGDEFKENFPDFAPPPPPTPNMIKRRIQYRQIRVKRGTSR